MDVRNFLNPPMDVEAYGEHLVRLDLGSKDSINHLINEIRLQYAAELENNREIRRPDLKAIMYFMTKQLQILEYIRNCRYETKTLIDFTLLDLEENGEPFGPPGTPPGFD